MTEVEWLRKGPTTFKLFLATLAIGATSSFGLAGEVPMQLMSSAFSEGQMIPAKYTCDGKNISLPLSWSGAPAEAKSLALIADDPDAPVGIWVHWVMYNLPSSLTELKEKIPAAAKLSDGSLQGTNDFGRTGYGGPCPPGGTHRYFFKLYALDEVLSLGPGVTKVQLEAAMKGHILAEAQLMGTYHR
jgi:Raf kinase inhibitor-like YbhB/YbcL family protein